MKCPYCGDEKQKVIDTRQLNDGRTGRSRECKSCNQRFKTVEQVGEWTWTNPNQATTKGSAPSEEYTRAVELFMSGVSMNDAAKRAGTSVHLLRARLQSRKDWKSIEAQNRRYAQIRKDLGVG